MPRRIIPFANEYYYHIYNRGVEKRSIFENGNEYRRFIKTIKYYQFAGPKPKLSKFLYSPIVKVALNEKIVEVVCYCLMPNHFHLLLKQLKDGGITEFISKLSNSYTKYYNTKHTRVGPLLQGEFKAVLVESDEQLVHLSRYIHLNPIASLLVRNLDDYRWSSYKEYIDDIDGICTKNGVMSLFKSPKDYQQFILDQVNYAQELELIKHSLIDVDE